MSRKLICLAVCGLTLGLLEGVCASGVGASTRATKPCITTVTSGAVVPANTPTAVNVKSIPKCAKLPSTGGFIDVGSEFAIATASGKVSLSVTSTTGFTATAGDEVNFIPVVPGTLDCTSVTGKLSFKPPMKMTGTAAVTETFSLKATGCAGSQTGSTVLHPGPIHFPQLPFPSTGCFPPLDSKPSPWPWPGGPVVYAASTVTFSADQQITNGSGDIGGQFPASGGTASVTGSFAGSDSGASSTMEVFSNMTSSQITASCSSKKGLRSISIVRGSIHLG